MKSPTSTKQVSGSSGSSAHRGLLGPPAGRQYQRRQALGGHHVDRLHDRRPPRRGAERPDHPGRPEDRDAAEDAEAGVGGPAGPGLAVRHRDHHPQAAGAQVDRGGDVVGDHLPRDRVDRRSADLQPEAGSGHHADAHPAVQLQAGRRPPAHGGGEMRAVRDVGVVAGVLDDDRLGAVGRDVAALHVEADQPLVGQHHVDPGLDLLAGQRGRRGLGGGRAAGAGRPAAAQRAGADLGGARQVGFAQLRAGHAGPRRARSCARAAADSTLRCSWKCPGWYRCDRVPPAASAGPTSTIVCL